MKRFCIVIIFAMLFCFINTHTLESPFEFDKSAYAQPDFKCLSEALYDLKPSELSLCVSFVINSDMSGKQIADSVYSWDPDKNKKTLGVVFRNRITRLVERLRRVDYTQLIIDIDLIKNSHLTTGQIIKLLKGESKNRG